MREHDYEPVRGLPERLPTGEEIVWQGAPDWRVLARRAFHVRKVAIYFLLLLAWRAVVVINDGAPLDTLAAAALWLVPMGAAAVTILAVLAWAHARTTVYTITTRRIVMRFGVAVSMSINLPFRLVEDAALKDHGDGTGDIALKIGGDDRLSYLHMWPHVRRWHIATPQPMLRAVPKADEVARILADTLQAYDGRQSSARDDARDDAAPAARHLAAAG